MVSARTEQIYVSRFVRRSLEDLAQLHLSAQPEGAEGPSISATADGLADALLRERLEQEPRLREQQREIRHALAAIKAKYAATAQTEGGA